MRRKPYDDGFLPTSSSPFGRGMMRKSNIVFFVLYVLFSFAALTGCSTETGTGEHDPIPTEAEASYLSVYPANQPRNVENLLGEDDGSGIIGDPWSFDTELKIAFSKGAVIFGNLCTGLTIDYFIVSKPYDGDTGVQVRLAQTLNLTKNHSLMWFFPAFFTLDDRLRELTFIHELGHACGLGHSTDVRSVMYPMIDEIVGPGIATPVELKILEVIWKPRFRIIMPGISN